MIKLISLDLDGTLLGPDGDLTPGAAEAIARAREAGLRVVLNTGRPMTEAGYFARKAGCDNLVSCLGGALLGDAQTGAELRRWDIPEPWGSRALEICLGRGLEITIFSGNQVVLDPFSKESLLRTYPYPEFHGSAIVTEDPLAYMKERNMPVTKIHGDWGPCPRAELEGLEKVELTTSTPTDFEIIPRGVNKGSTLALIALMYGIPLEQCAAVGDSENDLPMLEAAGLAIAMGNAPEHVRAAAQRVVDTNAQGGVVQAILSCLEH